MKNLRDYINEDGIAVSLGTEQANSQFMTPGSVTGMGNPKMPTPETPGSGDILGKTQTEKPKPKKEKRNTSKTKKEE